MREIKFHLRNIIIPEFGIKWGGSLSQISQIHRFTSTFPNTEKAKPSRIARMLDEQRLDIGTAILLRTRKSVSSLKALPSLWRK